MLCTVVMVCYLMWRYVTPCWFLMLVIDAIPQSLTITIPGNVQEYVQNTYAKKICHLYYILCIMYLFYYHIVHIDVHLIQFNFVPFPGIMCYEI